MKITKLNIQNKDFSNYSIQEWQDYFEKVFNNTSLHSVLATTLTQSYLSEVRDGIKETEYDRKKSLEYQEEEFLTLIDRENLPEEMQRKKELSWGAEPDWICKSWKDVTEIYTIGNRGKSDFYSTPEVLKVIDQWIEYLEKFEAEKK